MHQHTGDHPIIPQLKKQTPGPTYKLTRPPYSNYKLKQVYKHKKGSVYYSATPVYKGKELIPRSVVVDIKTSDGKINERVIVYNAVKGYKVDYKKGTLTETDQEEENKRDKIQEATYIVNTNTKKFHLPNCASVDQMKDKNKKTYKNVTISQLRESGYEPCQNCLKGK